MTTPPGDEDGGKNRPGDDQWTWEPRTFGEQPPPPVPPLPDEPAPPPEEGAALGPAQAAPGLAWEGEPPSKGAEQPATVAAGDAGFALAAAADDFTPPAERYPMRFDIAYPDRLSRWKTLLRWFLLVPPAIALYFVAALLSAALQVGWMTVFWRRKYPDWLFRGAQGAMGFTARVGSYALLTTDQFPSFSADDSPLTLEFDQPPSGQLSRWRVLVWKAFLLIPHVVVLWFLGLALWVVTFFAWLGILFSGNYPRGLFQFSVGVQRWYWRVNGYFASFNDRFPPYSLSAEAGPASNGTTVGSGIGGLVVGGAFVALIAVAMVVAGQHQTESVSYAQLLAGRGQQTNTFDVGVGDEAMVRLSRAVDPGDSLIQIIRPARGERIVVFQWTVVNGASSNELISADAARLEYRYSDGGKQKSRGEEAEFIGINNVSAPARVAGRSTATVQAVFVIPDDAEPTALWFHNGFLRGGVKYEFE